ncbi:Glucose/arabinose dehydrogenase, beta-propeller fold [Micromonospora rhizosphaerae]|uniref:Glucose/arabinose dehydrogenase, beta-propeller fold n=1 Tax=Micromonospora rhizosphaerae TaxID=568872 RepID=A0A1C6SX69_9ACTN|nr:PA14 domain-containing protein [Micromonospora rhizosphaerae]SCL34098.1 Glucose/arabinose dehydrogenase, beta-propeller fold [Micromonospora rhizosphaerae]
MSAAFASTFKQTLFLKVAALVAIPSVAMMAMLPAAPSAAAPPADFQTSLVVGDGLDGPSGFEIAPDGRIFVLERTGKIKIIKNGQLLPQPFADLPSEATGDRGLIGIAFDPDFGVGNHYVYFYYTGHDLLNHLVRFNASDDVGADGPYPLFQTQSPSQLLHVGGSVAFGPDGKLYLAIGDNGNGANSQDLGNPHGKILRINKDGSIPADNPFYGQPGKLGAIWAYGFRNPWRFQFDSVTGELYGGDVGDFTWEEVNHIVKGGNYGWPVNEGACSANCAGFVDPIYAYNHNGQSAAVTGGPVYRGAMFPPEYQGNLFFGDYATGFIKRGQLDGNGNITAIHDFDTQAGSVVDMKVAPDGSLYYLTIYPGALYRVSYHTTSHVPVANASADVTRGVDPLTVHFSSAGSNDPDGDPLTYLWNFGDGTTSSEANPTKNYPDKGVYTVRLTVSGGTDQTQAQPIVIQVGIPPTLTVAAPTEGMLYRAGDTITYNAFASDAAGFDLNDANIKTEVRLHHGTHYHPFLGPLTGRAGSFTIPTTGEASADTSYEITVTATDGNGLTATKRANIFPRKSHITLATSPPGLGLTLDSVPVSTPHAVDGVVGFKRELAAPTTAIAADGTVLQFAGWSDGRSIRHIITTPETDTTYTATYRPSLAFTGAYFDNTSLSGTPILTRQDPKIDFNWAAGSPDPAVPDNGFGVRWTKTQWFGAGRYKFTTVTDDGVRLYIDNRRVIDQWQGHPSTEYTYVTDLGEGNHAIKMEYFEGGGDALATLTWDSTADQPDESFHAEYWNAPPGINAIPGGPPTVARDEPAIDHDWGSGSPAPDISVDRFVARWTRTMSLAPGEYEFTATADDGERLTIDGVRVIDEWVDQPPTSYSVHLPLDGGPHTILMEYYENGGGAVARLAYSQVGDLPESPAYQGEYWNTPDGGTSPGIPTGPPDLVRSDPTLEFEWSDGSPALQISADHFVVRWTRTDVLSAGVYRFTGAADDGIRVFVDNVPVVDKWQLQNATFSVDKVVLGGPHVIRVEYFEHASGARAMVDYERIGEVVPADDGYSAEYFANQDLSGVPALTRQDSAVDFDWGGGSPGDGIPVDHFSARWTKSAQLAAGSYAFTVTSDDGVRLFVDGVKVLDKWTIQGGNTYTVTRQLGEGTHQIVLEYFESAGSAVARFGYVPTNGPPPPVVPFAAEYFANATLDGTPIVTRNDDQVDFDWGSGSPDPALPDNGFSARWARTTDFEAGTYRFTVTGDDGIRLRLDGNLIIDGWSDHPPTTYTADVTVDAGQHTVVVEYYERTGGAVARFSEVRL